VRARLDAALPDGIDVIEVAERGHEPPLAHLEASQWQLTLPGVPAAAAQEAIGEFLATSQVEVERLTKKGTRRMDARAAVISMELDRRAIAAQPDGYGILRMVVRHTTPAVRPDDILVALNRVTGLTLSAPPLVTRLAQGPLDEAAATVTPGPGSPEAAADRERET
jgi:Uncharacterized protein conserved in bacteria (DUF2344)